MVERIMMPPMIRAGTTLLAVVEPVHAMAPDWSATLHLRGPQAIDIEGEPERAGHRFHAPGVATASWAPGIYAFEGRARRGEDVLSFMAGRLTVEPDITASTGGDSRSHAERVLAAVEAVIEGRASSDQESYTINGRSLQRTPLRDLLALRSRYRMEVADEHAQLMGRRRPIRSHQVTFR